jgi:Mn-dependent DtxR family transcriptional regulator
MVDQILLNQLRKEKLIMAFEKNYNVVSPLWANHQIEWMNGVYAPFKDHDKYLIVLYLIKKTFDFYSKNFVRETFTEFYQKDFIQIESLDMMEISQALNIPKESARRKIIELEKIGVIKKSGKKIIIDKKAFPFIRPEKSIVRVSRFFATLSAVMLDEKIIQSEFTSDIITTFIAKNFSYIWKLYYELQIPLILKWKKVFKDVESFHIWGICVVNEKLNIKRSSDLKMNRKAYLKKYYNTFSQLEGMNAMSISDISGIPRATVTRKLNILLEKKYLKINDKKHYTLANETHKEVSEIQRLNFDNLADFTAQVFNLMLVEEKTSKKIHERLPLGAQKYLNL